MVGYTASGLNDAKATPVEGTGIPNAYFCQGEGANARALEASRTLCAVMRRMAALVAAA